MVPRGASLGMCRRRLNKSSEFGMRLGVIFEEYQRAKLLILILDHLLQCPCLARNEVGKTGRRRVVSLRVYFLKHRPNLTCSPNRESYYNIIWWRKLFGHGTYSYS